MSEIVKLIMCQLSARGIYYEHLYFTHWLIIDSLSKFVSKLIFFVVGPLWKLDSLWFSEVSWIWGQPFEIRYKSMLFLNTKIIFTQMHG